MVYETIRWCSQERLKQCLHLVIHAEPNIRSSSYSSVAMKRQMKISNRTWHDKDNNDVPFVHQFPDRRVFRIKFFLHDKCRLSKLA